MYISYLQFLKWFFPIVWMCLFVRDAWYLQTQDIFVKCNFALWRLIDVWSDCITFTKWLLMFNCLMMSLSEHLSLNKNIKGLFNLMGCSIDRLFNWSVVRMVSCSIGWLFNWLVVSFLIGRLVNQLVGWLGG